MTFLLPNKDDLDKAAKIVYGVMSSSPQYSWPLLNETIGAHVFTKHENHTPTGAFKVRGGLVYTHNLKQNHPQITGIISATRGNHGLSLGFAARHYGLKAFMVVPLSNSKEKNAAMRALGVTVVEYGNTIEESYEHAAFLADIYGVHLVLAQDRNLISGVATYWMEFLTAQPDLDVIFVPIGQGSGICAAICVREILGLSTRIIGVVSVRAPCYKLSFDQEVKQSFLSTAKITDGLACSVPNDHVLDMVLRYVDDVISVSDEEVADAMRLYFTATHNLAEGAGAITLAAAMQMKHELQNKKIGVPLTGGNVDAQVMSEILFSCASNLLAPEILVAKNEHALAHVRP